MAFGTATVVITGWSPRPVPLGLTTSSGLITIVGVLLLVALLLFFCQTLPCLLDVVDFMLPFLTNNFGDFRVGQFWIVSRHLGLMVLAVQNESCDLVSIAVTGSEGACAQERTISRSRNLWSGCAKTYGISNGVWLHDNVGVDAEVVIEKAMVVWVGAAQRGSSLPY